MCLIYDKSVSIIWYRSNIIWLKEGVAHTIFNSILCVPMIYYYVCICIRAYIVHRAGVAAVNRRFDMRVIKIFIFFFLPFIFLFVIKVNLARYRLYFHINVRGQVWKNEKNVHITCRMVEYVKLVLESSFIWLITIVCRNFGTMKIYTFLIIFYIPTFCVLCPCT